MRRSLPLFILTGGALCLAACNSSEKASIEPDVSPKPQASASEATTSKPKPDTKAPATKTNVILITIDSLRADRMPWHKYRHDVVPNLAKFAKTAVNYTQFHSISSYTSMTFGGLLAARYPSEVPRSGYFFSSIPPEVETFPEVLQKSGVATMAAHGHWYFGKEDVGLDQGFDTWELVAGLKKSNTTDNNITSPAHVALAKKQLGAQSPDKPFFAWYHLMDPHDMYMGHAGTPRFGKGAAADYDGELHFTDRHLGELLQFIDTQPWAKNTAVMISADHGETFGEHKMHRHGFELWQELTWVPLLIRVPGGKPRAIDTPRGGVDLPMTILDLLGAKPPAGAQGVSLVPELRGADAKPRPVVTDLPRTSDNDRRRAIIIDNDKLIAHSDDEYFKLFDVGADPRETKDLAGKDRARLERMRKRYEEVSKTIVDVCPKMRKLKGKKKNRPC